MVQKIDIRKLFGTILGILVFIGTILFVTYSYYTWKSEDTLVTLNITDYQFYCESGIDGSVDSLAPVFDYRDGSYKTFIVNNIGSGATTFSLNIDITSIDDSLLSPSLKYKLVADRTAGSNNCADINNNNCVEVGEGDFSEFKVGTNNLVSSIGILENSKYQYYLFVYIDGTMENDISMQNSSMTATLGVCEIVVYLDANGGTISQDFLKLADNATQYPTLPTPTRDNSVVTYNYNNATGGNSTASETVTYTFNNWYKSTDTSFTTPIHSGDSLSTTTNLNLKARWTVSKSITLPTPTRTGYTFDGWYSDEALTNRVGDAGAIYNPSKSVTLYAKWIANVYTITYYNGTTLLGTFNYSYDTSQSLPTWLTLGGVVTNSSYGWSFEGWSTSNTNTTRTYTDGQVVSKATSTSGGNVNLYAVYKRTITFKHGESAGQSSTVTQYWNPYGTTNGQQVGGVTSPTPTAITNWTALGFRNDTTADTKEYNYGETIYPAVGESATLYGVYSRVITFYSGIVTDQEQIPPVPPVKDLEATQYLNSNNNAVSAISTGTPSTITNWTILGYRDDTTAGGKEYNSNTSYSLAYTTGNSMYAVYSRTLTITYNANGGTGSTSNTTKTVYLNSNSTTTSSQSVTLASNGFSKVGYNFSKWAAGSTSGTQYAKGATYTAGVAYDAATFGTTIYAIWTRNFTCSAVGSNTTYAGKTWRTIAKDSTWCTLALNQVSKSTGTYNEAGSKLTSEYLTSGGSSYNSTITAEKNANLLTIVSGSYYIDANVGSSYTDASGNTQTIPQLTSGGIYWYASGKVYNTASSCKNYTCSNTRIFYNAQQNSVGSSVSLPYQEGCFSQPSYTSCSGAQSVTNTSSTWTIKPSYSTASFDNYYTTQVSEFVPTVSYSSTSASSTVLPIAKQGYKWNGSSYTTSGSAGGFTNTGYVFYRCGGSSKPGSKIYTFSAGSDVAYSLSAASAGNASTTGAITYKAGFTYDIAGSTSSTLSSGVRTYYMSDDTSCVNTWTKYTITSENKSIYYRPRIKVKYT